MNKTMKPHIQSKWYGLLFYDRPLGARSEGVDDGRPVVWITDFTACGPARRTRLNFSRTWRCWGRSSWRSPTSSTTNCCGSCLTR